MKNFFLFLLILSVVACTDASGNNSTGGDTGSNSSSDSGSGSGNSDGGNGSQSNTVSKSITGSLSTTDSQTSGGYYYDTIEIDNVPDTSEIEVFVYPTGFDATVGLFQGNISIRYVDFSSTDGSEFLYDYVDSGTYIVIISSASSGEIGTYQVEYDVLPDTSGGSSNSGGSSGSSGDSCTERSCGECSRFSYLSCSCVVDSSDQYCTPYIH